MDFTADYGLKTRQVASCLWLRRGVLITLLTNTKKSPPMNAVILALRSRNVGQPLKN